jgi:hypothetical protein
MCESFFNFNLDSHGISPVSSVASPHRMLGACACGGAHTGRQQSTSFLFQDIFTAKISWDMFIICWKITEKSWCLSVRMAVQALCAPVHLSGSLMPCGTGALMESKALLLLGVGANWGTLGQEWLVHRFPRAQSRFQADGRCSFHLQGRCQHGRATKSSSFGAGHMLDGGTPGRLMNP